jgi:hypothetical protein
MKNNEEEFQDVQGELKKYKTSAISKLFGSFNLRYFEINFKKEEFGYKLNKYDKLFKSTHRISDILDFTKDVPAPIKAKCDWRFGFIIKTQDKDYIVFAVNYDEMQKWIFALNIILKRIPEAFPKISDTTFQSALSIFYDPYMKNLEYSRKNSDIELLKKKKE